MKHYEDRFRMTPEQSLFLAKKKWDENVYCGMRMENRKVASALESLLVKHA